MMAIHVYHYGKGGATPRRVRSPPDIRNEYFFLYRDSGIKLYGTLRRQKV